MLFSIARNKDNQSLKRGGKMAYLSVDFDVFQTLGNLKHINLEAL